MEETQAPMAGAKSPWIALAGATIGMAISSGPAYIGLFGIFMKPVSEATGWSRGAISAALGVSTLFASLLLPLIGVFLDRWGARRVILLGYCTLPLAMACYYFAGESYTLFAGITLVSMLLSSFIAPISFLYLVPQYFERHLGLATSVVLFGLGLGGLAMPVLASVLITRLGWETAWPAMAAVVAGIGLTCATLLIHDHPLHRSRPAIPAKDGMFTGNTLGEAVRTLLFWELSGVFLLIVMTSAGIGIHFAAMMSDRGYSPTTAALAGSIGAIGGFVGRLSSGLMLDRYRIWVPCTIFFGGQALGVLLILLLKSGTGVVLGSLLIGAAAGAEFDIMPFTLRRAFGLRAYGRIFGLSFGILSMGAFIGNLLVGQTYELFKSYDFALLALAATTILGTLIMIDAARRVGRRMALLKDEQPSGAQV